MAEKATHDASRAEEAKNLAADAVEARQHGDREEGEFLADAARGLDPAAASKVLKQG